jgi:hypothetical protein
MNNVNSCSAPLDIYKRHTCHGILPLCVLASRCQQDKKTEAGAWSFVCMSVMSC